MNLNSRPMTQTTASRSAVLPSNNAADAYSNDLMDDLFSDVDQILGGDLSDYMTVVGQKPRATQSSSSTVRASSRPSSSVQLPTPFSAVPSSQASSRPLSYTLNNTTAAKRSSKTTRPHASHVGRSVGDRSYSLSARRTQPVTRNSGFGGGRPLTTPRKSAARSGNFQAAVIQSPANTTIPSSSQNIYGTPDDPIQSVSNYLYPKAGQAGHRDFTFASPRPPHTIFEPEAQKQVSLPFLLMGAAGISAVSTAGLWALSQSAPNTGWMISLNRQASAAELPGNSTEDFLAYLGRSLDVISAKQASRGQTLAAVIPVANRTPSLPTTVPNTNSAPQSSVLPNLPGATATNASPNIIERVFVPVYQNEQQPQAKAAPSVPSVAVPNSNAQLPKVPVPAPVAAAAAIPPGAPANPAPSVPVVPVGASALPTPTPPIPVAISSENAAAVTDTTPTSEHVLVGVLNLGSRSAALFNIEGTSQRAYVGDRIGVSDWTLVSVNGQDVQVRRNGEVRSVYIGQKF